MWINETVRDTVYVSPDYIRRHAMSKNVGVFDRVLRVIAGLVLIAYAVPVGFPATGWNWVGWIGVVPLITALIGVCPLYSVVGLSTCRR